MTKRFVFLMLALAIACATCHAQLKLMREKPRGWTTPGKSACNGDGLVCVDKTTGEVRESATGRAVGQLPIAGDVMSLSSDGSVVAVGYGKYDSAFHTFGVWDIATGRLVFRRWRGFVETGEGTVSALSFSKDGKYLALVTDTGVGEIWDAVQWGMINSVSGFVGVVGELDFSSDSQLVVYHTDGTAQSWAVRTQDIQSHKALGSSLAPSVATVPVENPNYDLYSRDFELTPDDRLLLPGDPARVFDLRLGKLEALPALGTYDALTGSFSVSSANRVAVSKGTNGYVLDSMTLRTLEVTDVASGGVMAISRDGKMLAQRRFTDSGWTKLVIIRTGTKSETEYEPGVKIDHLRFSTDGSAVIVSTDSGGITAYAVADGKPIWLPKLFYPNDAVSDDLTHTYQLGFFAGQRFVRIFDVLRRRGLYEIALDPSPGATFSDDGSLLAVPLLSGPIVVLDVATHQRMAVLSGFPGDVVRHMCFTADKKRLIASGVQAYIRIWDLASQTELMTLSVQKAEWAVSTGSGYYDGTDGELKDYYWARGTKTMALAGEASEHRISGLAGLVWRGDIPAHGSITTESAISSPDLPGLELDPNTVAPDVGGNISIEARIHGGPGGTTLAFGTRNGVPLHVAEEPGRPGIYLVKTRLENGSNRIVLWAKDSLGRLSSERIAVRDYSDQSKPHPELVVRNSPVSLTAMTTVAFSRDGSMMATAAGHAITLWDMRTKRQVRTMLGHANNITGIEFGAVNSTLVSTASQDGVRIWSTISGREVCRVGTLSGSGERTPFAISGDGALIAVADRSSGLARVFRSVDCAEEASFDSGWSTPAWIGNRQLVMQTRSAGHDELISVSLDSAPETHLKATSEVEEIGVLPDGRCVLLVKGGKIQVQTKTGDLQSFSVDPSLGEKVSALLVLRSGQIIVDAGYKQYLYATDGHTVEHTWAGQYLQSVAVSDGGRWIGFVDTNGQLAVYNRLSAVKEVFPMKQGYGSVTQLQFSPSGEVLSSARGRGHLQFWDVATSSVIRSFGPLKGNAAWFATTGIVSLEGTAGVGNKPAPMETVPFIFDVERGQSGQLIVIKAETDQIHDTIVNLPARESELLWIFQGWSLSGNAKIIALGGRQAGELRVVDLLSGRDISRFRPHPSTITGVALSSDGALILTSGDGTDGNSVRLWKKDGTAVWRREGLSSYSLNFSDDSKLVAIGDSDRVLILDAANGEVRKTLEMETASVSTVAFSPGNRRIAVGTVDGLIHLYDLGSGKRLATLAAEEDGELAYTAEAFYGGTLTKSTALSFRLGNRVYPLTQFDLFFNRPDLVMQNLAPELQSVILAYKVAHDKRLQEAKITEVTAPSNDGLPEITFTGPTTSSVDSRELILPISARTSGDVPLSYIEIKVNGVAEVAVNAKGRKTFESNVQIILSSGTNEIELTAIDSHQRRSLTEQLTIQYKGKTSTTLYLVSIGVSQYSNQLKNLNSAAKDATDLANFYRSDAKRPLGSSAAFDKIIVTDPITNSTATRENILKVRETLAKADVDDTVIVFFAGHGMFDAKLDWYFAPYDMDFDSPARHGISMAEMEGIVDPSHSRKRLLLVDACNSGELDKSGVTSTAVNGVEGRGVEIGMTPGSINPFELLRSLFVDLRENTGTEIIVASRGQEVAHETNENGLFTGALLEGLQGEAANGDGHISVSQLMNFVADKVLELSHGSQTPMRRQQNIQQDFLIQ